MRPLNLKSLFDFTLSNLHHTQTTPFLLTPVSSLSSLPKTPNPIFADFLIHAANLSEADALTIASATRYSNLKSLGRPHSVLHYFRNLGFSKNDIQSAIRACPEILFYDIDKTLKPKIEFFQQLGLPTSHQGKFFSKTSQLLKLSLQKNLVPSIDVLRKILGNDKNNENLFKVLSKNPALVGGCTDSKLLPNIRFVESCGIVGNRLAMLLRGKPRILNLSDVKLRNLVSRVSEMGFEMHSGMFVHAVAAVFGYNAELFEQKVETFKGYGFSKEEFMTMFRKFPYLITSSEKRLIIGLDFYLKTVKLKKEVLICYPDCLNYSMETRVIPRYKVLQIISSKKLLKKEYNLPALLNLTDADFLRRFIFKFPDHTEELLMVYRGHNLDHSSQKEISTS